MQPNSILIEPSAGDGKFLDHFKIIFPDHKYQAYDIEINHPEVIKQDFLKLTKSDHRNYVVIGNPPFGHRAKLAINFVNHATKFADIICFVVPIQFQRWSVQKQINPNYKLIYSSAPLAPQSFLFQNRSYSVNCCLQIWIHQDHSHFRDWSNLRILKAPPNRHPDFQLWIHNNTKQTLKYFDQAKYQWDFAIVRQGYYNYHDRISNPNQLVANRQYLFVKYLNPIAKQVFAKIDFEKLSYSNTTIRAYSNTDVIAAYQAIKDRL